jgi:hypothetical protein
MDATASFHQVLNQLLSPACGVCRHHIATASCFDEIGYDQLGAWFDEAVVALNGVYGMPIQPQPSFPGEDVERAACWRVRDRVVYALLSWGDNTRNRTLTLGIAARGTVVSGCWKD